MVAVPEIVPAELMERPGGSPLALQLTVPVPPEEPSVALYAEPATALPSVAVVVVIASGTGTIEILSCCVAESGVPAESVTFTVKVELPGAVGVPVMIPPVLSESPTGSDPLDMLHVSGATPPLAVSVAEYAVPTIPEATVEIVITGTGLTVIVAVAVLLASCTEVAVTVTLVTDVTVAGAVYVTLVVVELLSVPPPETLQFTPELPALVTVAERLTVCPASMLFVEPDEIVTPTGPPPPHPERAARRTTQTARANDFPA